MAIKNQSILLLIIVSISAFCGLLFGYDTGVIAGVMIFLQKQFFMTAFEKEFIVSMVLIGAIVGSAFSGKLVDYFGERKLMFVSGFSFILGTLISCLSPTPFEIAIGRFIIGIAIGIASYTAPLYIAEISPKEKRGSLVIINTIAVTGGIVIAYLIDLLLAPTGAWRWMFALGIIPAVILVISLFLLPDSPRWLVKQNKLSQAYLALLRVRTVEQAKNELSEIEQNVMQESKIANVSLLRFPIRVLLFLGIGLSITQQISGINTILYYAPTIFKISGFSSTNAQLMATLGVGITNFIFTIIAMIFVDHLGRRKLLLIGFTVMTLCLATVAYTFLFIENIFLLKWLSLGGTVLFVASYALSIGCLFWLIISEIFPLNIRGQAMSIAAMFNWLSNLAITLSFLSLLGWLGSGKLFLFYTITCALSCAFCYRFVPETKKVSLEEIESKVWSGYPSREIGYPVKTANKK